MNNNEFKFWKSLLIKGSIFAVIGILALMFTLPMYNVWASGMSGRAKLQEAEYSRQTRVAEAQARFDSAKLDADSKVALAKGQAEANKLIAETLTPEVLQYQYIQMLEERNDTGKETIIYIPTDPRTGLPTSLPLPEANRLQSK